MADPQDRSTIPGEGEHPLLGLGGGSLVQGGRHLTNVIKDGKLVALSGVSPEEKIALELTERLN